MSADSTLIDDIVRGVLQQLGGGSPRAVAKPSSPVAKVSESQPRPAVAEVEIAERIVTADLLKERVNGSRLVVVGQKALVTPAAWDFIRERGLTLNRGEAKSPSTTTGSSKSSAPQGAKTASLLIVVRSTEAVERLAADLPGSWRRELLGCPDDAAKLAIGELSRGGTPQAVILAEQAHRAACLANRSDAAKAVAVRDAGDVPVVRKQLRANVWCVDPSGRSWFELRNLLRAISQ
ncbi:MAG: hypothetical protein JNG89_11090 [Planctomycetaceae bacterium]|nr:hypothetical protein [Planctomycetaceae bacterium]